MTDTPETPEIARIREALAENETLDVCAVHAVALPDNAELCGERSESERAPS